jgi:RHS repeat-associated protein
MFDEATGLQNNLNRWYDPKVGRWLSEDPIEMIAGDPNFYRYVKNMVTGLLDPSGLQECPPPGHGRVYAKAGGGGGFMNPAVAPEVLDQLQAGKSGERPIEETMHVPGYGRVTGRDSLKPFYPDEIVNARTLLTPTEWDEVVKKGLENTVVAGGEESIAHGVLRDLYLRADARLGQTAQEFVRNGMRWEDAAQWRSSMTNKLKVSNRAWGNSIVDILAKLRAQKPGALPDLPSFEKLVEKYTKKGMSYEDACKKIVMRKPNLAWNRARFGLYAAGTLLFVVDLGATTCRVIEAPTWQQKLRTLATEAARITGAAGGAWAGARLGGKLGGLAGPEGGVAGGVVGAAGGAIVVGATAEAAVKALVYSMFPPDQAELQLLGTGE